MKTFYLFLFYTLCVTQSLVAQPNQIDRVKFFTDQTIFKAKVVTNLNKMIYSGKEGKNPLRAYFICKLPDSTDVKEKVTLETRGHFRRENCTYPPLKIVFNKPDSTVLSSLKSLKLVSTCKASNENSQYLIKEYLSYKLYNLLTDKSFRVRLVDMDFIDSSGKKKPFKEFAFFTEDEKEMAKRNNCKDWTVGKPPTEAMDRAQMTLVSIFEYMIGNTDWSVPARHNIKTILSKADPDSKPFSVPYDFDFAGLVNTDYATPDAMFGTVSVQERVYRGYARTMDELNATLDLFIKQKNNFYALINNCEYLNPNSKKGMIKFLEDFYSSIKNPKEVKSIFIDNARTQ